MSDNLFSSISILENHMTMLHHDPQLVFHWLCPIRFFRKIGRDKRAEQTKWLPCILSKLQSVASTIVQTHHLAPHELVIASYMT
uniref:Uncharacterized protein n=1 Tax=Pyxicephalus adspersus TaxID=30357 RepID=A0AAV3ADM8_PYXAD|nr:TPA: hypothetical protein GDO54_009628 [Pyxicephalus adspersus]